MNPQMRLVILLAVVWASGSLLFAAERSGSAAPAAESPAEPATDAASAQPANDGAAAQPPGTPSAEKPTEAEPAPGEPAGKEPGAPPQEAGAEEEGAKEDGSEGAGAEEAGAEGDRDPAPPKERASTADRAASPQRFTPSEQVRADFDVSFPIDI